VAAAEARALKDLRRLKEKAGGRNKLPKLLDVTGPYIGRVLKGEKPMTDGLVEKIRETLRLTGVVESKPHCRVNDRLRTTF
jgi:hypothetical protein